MKNKDYTASFEVSQPAMQVFNAITNVTNWWSKDFKGSSTKLNDVFIIDHPGQHYSKQRVVELVPGKKIVWLVTESQLNWLKKNREEWSNTKMTFVIWRQDDKTLLQFTHEGLDPEKECYAMCAEGWDIVIKDWLYHLVTAGTASPKMVQAAEIRNRHLQSEAAIENKNYHKTIITDASPEEAMRKIRQINRWWKRDFPEIGKKLNDQFTIEFGEHNGERSYVDFVVNELIPAKKITWKVLDCYLPWFHDKKEWNNTEVVFELSGQNGKTKIDFMHIGLVPELACYDVCEKGWDGHISSLQQFISVGKEIPEAIS